MHPELIKAEIRMRGTTAAAIADDMGLTRTAVTAVIANRSKSQAIRERIAALLGKQVNTLWPIKPSSGVRRNKKAVAV